MDTSMARRVCVVTGSRAEYGLLYWVLDALRSDPDFELQLVVTGMHLAPEFGLTVRDIERDGFAIAERVEMLLSSDTPGGVARSVGLGVIGFSQAIEHLRPEWVLVLGDRFEILAAATAALMHNVGLVHIAGGDITEGAIDESIRHAITKMAQVHFVTNEAAARRVRQMGEDPAYVHLVGSPGLDHLRRTPMLSRDELEHSLGASLGRRSLLVTFHPVTLEPADSERQFAELLAALATLEDSTLWFTQPNADAGGRALAAMLDDWAASRPNAHVFASLGQQRYLSLMREVDAVVGNSSSGLYEAPSLGVATLDIGERQRGRLAASSVVHCEPERDAILVALGHALALDCRGVVNPYGDGYAAERIVAHLRALPPSASLLKKPFHAIGA
jgi:UDP-hydrolysing UDP-N-acetyl-D-glucosamine 2-epimerase